MTQVAADPFATAGSLPELGEDYDTMANAAFGVRTKSGRYKLPLLPGERGPKAGGDWIPGGYQSATNLAGAIVESRQLGIWERERSQIGLAMRPDLTERLAFLINKAHRAGFDFTQRLHDSPEGKAIVKELGLIHDEARQSAYGNLAAQRGTNRHDAWEARAPLPDGSPGELFGTPEVNSQIEQLEALLAAKGLERVPGLQERVVRNTTLRAAGRFDDVLRCTKPVPGCNLRAGDLVMADLKTKQRSYYSWLEVRIQLTVYATAEWMLAVDRTLEAQQDGNGARYVPGPKHHVSQQWGVILWAPSNGDEPQLKRANLIKGWEHAMLARQVCDARSEAKNVAAHNEAAWPDVTPKDLEETR